LAVKKLLMASPYWAKRWGYKPLRMVAALSAVLECYETTNPLPRQSTLVAMYNGVLVFSVVAGIAIIMCITEGLASRSSNSINGCKHINGLCLMLLTPAVLAVPSVGKCNFLRAFFILY
jgi:hypothetical protein